MYYLYIMERYCLECGERLSGRSDKLFCCDSCRSNWHNTRARKKDVGIRRINSILKRNHTILEGCILSGKTHIGTKELIDKSFNPYYFTSAERSAIRRRFYCYDIPYRLSADGSLTIECRVNDHIQPDDGSEGKCFRKSD